LRNDGNSNSKTTAERTRQIVKFDTQKAAAAATPATVSSWPAPQQQLANNINFVAKVTTAAAAIVSFQGCFCFCLQNCKTTKH